jgi:hypothetical protein
VVNLHLPVFDFQIESSFVHEVVYIPSEDTVVPPFLHYDFGVYWCKRPLDGSDKSVTEINDNDITTGSFFELRFQAFQELKKRMFETTSKLRQVRTLL